MTPVESLDDPLLVESLSLFCRRVSSIQQEKEPLSSLLQISASESGEITGVRSQSLQTSLLFLLEKLCAFSLTEAVSTEAIASFLGKEVATVPDSAKARAEALYSPIIAEVLLWFSESSLFPYRHQKFLDIVERESPAIMTLVEYDQTWRALPLPQVSSRSYASARDLGPEAGKGQASVLYDEEIFTPVIQGEFEGLHLPGFIRSEVEQGIAGGVSKCPKSSCLVLLRQKVDREAGRELHLVVAVHLASAPPSDSDTVRLRRAQIRSILSEISGIAAYFRERRIPCVVILGGDFNALREEFLHRHDEAL